MVFGVYFGFVVMLYDGGIFEIVICNEKMFNSVDWCGYVVFMYIWCDIDVVFGVCCVFICGEGWGFLLGGDFEFIEEMVSDFIVFV